MRWFRVYAERIDDPKFIKLGPELRSTPLVRQAPLFPGRALTASSTAAL